VAYALGIEAEGYDLNPAMVVVAKAKTLGRNVYPSLISLLDDICAKADDVCDISANDPLANWFGRQSASAIRSIEKSIFSLLIRRDGYTGLGRLTCLSSVSALAAFFFVALFRAIR